MNATIIIIKQTPIVTAFIILSHVELKSVFICFGKKATLSNIPIT